MKTLKLVSVYAFGALLLLNSAVLAREQVTVSCKFESMPPMILTFRGDMGASDNTLQVGQTKPVALSVGSNLMMADYGVQTFTFSLRLPASVSVSAPGQDTRTFDGECISSLQPN